MSINVFCEHILRFFKEACIGGKLVEVCIRFFLFRYGR